ncbi:MAG: hypothetical protein IJI01_10430 [Butyrivibrio sp.]|uniref:O-antigen ligase family protein n=1 Tax=Butyrivibrio sp. TaxID=28121 RepID=UPI0025B955A8|nr:hypothetical protein [Butyrivibrio sp.]MBQ6589082.1 hypothetical protein [Butyrivibrio sp.]
MRQIISKKTAISITTILIALVAILSVFPLRVWTTVQEYSAGGELTEYSGVINYEYTLKQKFVSQYDRLSSVDVYVSEMINGRYIGVSVYDENAAEILRTFIDTDGLTLPGFVNVPMELNLEVGKEYYVGLNGCRSKYIVGLENLTGEAGYVGGLFYNWEEIPARHIYARYNYRIPMAKSISMIVILAIAAACIVILLFTELFFKKNPDKNTLSTGESALRVVANPIAAVCFASLMIMVFPLRVFDSRVADIIFYEAGLLIAAAMVFYGINHKVVSHRFGISFWDGINSKNRVIYVLQMLMIALAIWHANDYMNGLYDIFHTLSERRMVICLLLLIILTFSFKDVFNPFNFLWFVASVAGGLNYYSANAVSPEEKEFDLKNMALKYLIIIVILAGFIVINIIRSALSCIAHNIRSNKKVFGTSYRITVFGFVLILLFAMLIIFRNTRTWGIYLALIYGGLYFRLYYWKGKRDWYRILSGGLMLNFAISLGYSLLYRYFPGYVSGRFAFIFHTVTVTAEYLTFMGAVATVMLAIKVVAFPKRMHCWDLFRTAWKELILFGWIMAYAIFTVSRTAYVAICAVVLAVLLVVVSQYRKQFFRIVAVMVAAVIVCFPAAFTLQRIVPTIVSQPVFYVIDDADAGIRGGASWDNPNFMCVERFVNLFGTKILGIDADDYFYPVDVYNYDGNRNPVLDNYGYPLENSVEEYYQQQGAATFARPVGDYLVANGFTRAEYLMLMDTLNGYVDLDNRLDVVSNGRITIFKSYLKELNMYGHEEMGAELPNGEIAVHAHNTYIQVAYDNGIITGAVFVLLILSAIISGISMYRRNKNNDPLTLISFAITIGFVVAGMTEWVFHLCNPMTVALMLSFAGMIFKEKTNE